MKFFTIDWWAGEIDHDHMRAFDDYRDHIEGILPRLSEDHRRLLEEVTLHDSHLLKLTANISEESVVMDLEGSGYDESTSSYFGRRFELQYNGVQSIETTADPEKGLPGPHGYGDLGYDELHLAEPDLFEHRMLFSTGIILSIRHQSFRLRFEDSQQNAAEQVSGGNGG